MTKSTRGFGMIEVMIAAALVIIVSLQVASLFDVMNGNSNNLKGVIGSQSLQSSLLQIISNQNTCYSHLMSNFKTPGYFNIGSAMSSSGLNLGFQLDDGVGTANQVYTPASAATPLPLINYDVSVNYVSFKTSSAVPIGVDPTSGGSLYLGTLVVGLLKLSNANQKVAGGRLLNELSIGSLLLAVDASNDILNCYTQPLSVIAACASLGGTYVQGGNPPCELPYPCPSGQVFMGYSAGSANCQSSAALTVMTCAPGHTVVSNGSGFVCQ